ncbi:transglutaminase family protein [Azospirillum brasilense]|uniref:Transglutaminase family protein n=1 Tax=Azospirillum brasilense TaxID=192 RepID=A0A0P0EE23_AZOBR|nr:MULTISPECIES: transglutaminase family protein [Azospirillum]ALJ37321.1 IMP dehydrogenase [Azospirillum brasilense]MDW7552049.1 transglutaminase family protein [Azospirillum brasilense]MDW7591484.1 transglutaminase family protein [Azospirillum brasilense]MDW7626654.1 transglutaminase family protein [Azospirillum brasilense]MDX5950997.1 transglutaminase family protein [Azospirillum brasilense]
MAIHVALNHKTVYRYDRLVNLGPQIIRLRPAPHCRTPILSYSLRVTPKHHFLNWQQDPQSNYQARFVFPEKTREFIIEVDLVAEIAAINPFDFFLEEKAQTIPFAYEPWLERELRPYLEVEEPGPLLADYMTGISREPAASINFLVDINQRLQTDIGYVIRLEPGIQTCEETLGKRTGSCRDSAWLLVQILRNLGLAARFVSGYLIQLTADQKALDGPSGPEEDFTDLHAWTEVFLPGAGWVGLDPTSGLLAGEGHIPLACTPDASSAAPISGLIDECEVEFGHEMSVTRIYEAPRVTKPYTPRQWTEIEALGHRIDEELTAGDVRLTMGGEPTFVSIDDMDGAEWNTTALGPNKRKMAADLVHRLANRFAPGGLLHFGQGKWYPGESLPRWAMTVYWRRDGEALWANSDLLAREDTDYGHTAEDAGAFLVSLAKKLGLDPALVLAAYEDPWHYLRRESLLPVNVDPLDSKLEDKEERARLAHVFTRGLNEPVGFALPINRKMTQQGPVWLSSAWPLRQERLLLMPGDSPVGYRLPLGSLPWVAPQDYPYSWETDPFEERAPLPPNRVPLRQHALREEAGRQDGRNERVQRAMAEVRSEMPEHGKSAWWVVRTALTCEARNGRIHLFMPPMNTLEDYLAMLAEIEATALELDMPVVIEGYQPPKDPRLNSLAVTPDPGVIEVNIHPSHNWDELVRNTLELYEDARQSRLGAEKFMIDGRHCGTGGGNHVVMGGATAADSPFLRRPDMLRSLIAFWQNHPSLSYAFSGLFIGPTSQAPRVDEARDDALYELEIAFNQIDKAAATGDCPPWMVDRVLRNLLTDVQGNTHRAEFCIDKLYSPDSSTGRLGLVEFRAFEMPPHAEMSLTQQLLLRALVARFWKAPYKGKLVRWGTELHDRFMLPYFVQQDLADVIADLRDHGYPIEERWFDPHMNFRFPIYGHVNQRGISLELRMALEPWNVLGEEPGGGGTVRYVDSSVERVQVRVAGLTDARYAITCNGRRVPLIPTGTEGEFVAGVRYRAWQPPSCLHPTIPVHTPLVFDILDLWAGRSIGGCTYHVMHPGGRNYDTFPVNANEAEGRRLARFFPFGHTPGPMDAPTEERNPQFPMTLDLRRG